LGAQVWRVRLRRGRIPWTAILRKLAAKGAQCDDEGGGDDAAWHCKNRLWINSCFSTRR
jgi:hypothetical protein